MRKSVNNEMSPVDLIAREMKDRKLRNVDVSRMLNLSPSSITAMFKQKDMSVDKLILCCHGFKYNFFEELASKLVYPCTAIPGLTKAGYTALINNLKTTNNELVTQNKTLQSSLDEANEKLKMLEVEHKIVKEIMNKLIEGRI